jgi:hypothetical protein
MFKRLFRRLEFYVIERLALRTIKKVRFSEENEPDFEEKYELIINHANSKTFQVIKNASYDHLKNLKRSALLSSNSMHDLAYYKGRITERELCLMEIMEARRTYEQAKKSRKAKDHPFRSHFVTRKAK